jgi:ribosomal-protein-alanine N-acetyltransferase
MEASEKTIVSTHRVDEIKIEKMVEADLPEVMAIENVSFPTPFSINLFRMELNLGVAHLWIARKEQKVVGFIDYWRVGPEVHLITIAVHPEFRNQKIASLLIEKMIHEAKAGHAELINLDVRPSNEKGLKLYRKYGFEQVGYRKKYYQDNHEDALVMSLSLENNKQLPERATDDYKHAG